MIENLIIYKIHKECLFKALLNLLVIFMKYKLIAVDLDGTLLDNNSTISNENMKAIKYAVEKGIIIIPCTGRAIQGITKFNFLVELGSFAVAYNGGMVINLKNKEITYNCPLLHSDADFIINKGLEYNTNICVWSDNNLYCNKINQYTLSYSKISGVEPIEFNNIHFFDDKIITKVLWHDDEENISNFLKSMGKDTSENVSCCTSKPWFLEFFNSSTSKGLALSKICNKLEISRNEIIAFGDELNDISMLEYARLGIAMRNAKPEVKKIADFITSSNSEDGFAQAIYTFI